MPRVAARKPGRPVTTGRGHAGPRVTLRLSATELAILQRVAAAQHLTVATYAREIVLHVAEQDAIKVGT